MPIDFKLWQWQRLVASEHGPAHATTRHVLLTVALRMQWQGKNAWPSQALLALDTGLSERSISTHLHKAIKAGFLEMQHRKSRVKHAWFVCEYVAAVPAGLEGFLPEDKNQKDEQVENRSGCLDSPIHKATTSHQHPANGAEQAANDDTTSCNPQRNSPNHLQTNSSTNSLIKKTKNSSLMKSGIREANKPYVYSSRTISDEALLVKIQKLSQIGCSSISSLIKQLEGHYQEITQDRIVRIITTNTEAMTKEQEALVVGS